MGHVHIIGAGLAGLAAALSLTEAGRRVSIHESGPAAGGRCRSYFDRELGLRIDNGNHLLLSGNRAAQAYLAETGASAQMDVAADAVFPFVDLRTQDRWVVHLNAGRVPWWILQKTRRVPQARLRDYIRMAAITRIRDDSSVAASMPPGALYGRLLEPLAVAALNTPPETGLARLLGAVMRETLMLGGAACRPMIPREGLSEALVEPALATLRARGATIRFNHRIAGITLADGRIAELRGPDGPIVLAPEDQVILAVPPPVAADLLPGLTVPNEFQAILNIHYLHQATIPGPFATAGLIGLIAGTAEWVFRKQGHVSVTISAANRLVDEPASAIAALVWPDVVAALGLDPQRSQQMPPFRVVKERRATFAATAEQERRRPPARLPMAANAALAGDWTDTGLPATIEGAIRSGRAAAAALLAGGFGTAKGTSNGVARQAAMVSPVSMQPAA